MDGLRLFTNCPPASLAGFCRRLRPTEPSSRPASPWLAAAARALAATADG